MSYDIDRDTGDVGPGFMEAAHLGIGEGIRGYLIGLALSVLLTAASVYVLYTQLIWGGSRQVGCASAVGADEEFLVCRYSDAGNVMGQRPA